MFHAHDLALSQDLVSYVHTELLFYLGFLLLRRVYGRFPTPNGHRLSKHTQSEVLHFKAWTYLVRNSPGSSVHPESLVNHETTLFNAKDVGRDRWMLRNASKTF